MLLNSLILPLSIVIAVLWSREVACNRILQGVWLKRLILTLWLLRVIWWHWTRLVGGICCVILWVWNSALGCISQRGTISLIVQIVQVGRICIRLSLHTVYGDSFEFIWTSRDLLLLTLHLIWISHINFRLSIEAIQSARCI